MRLPRHIPIYSIFVVSGATSLAYEVVWTRLLVRVFGATSFAVTTVLASYMAGLALGSYVFGRLVDKRWSPETRPGDTRAGEVGAAKVGFARSLLAVRHPVRLYGLLELGIGLFALVFPLVILALNGFYRAIYPGFEGNYQLLTLVRFVLCFLVLLVPTTLMGGTLPVLGKYIAGSRSTLTGRIGALYAVNTFGAAAGAFATGYLLLPQLGVSRTTWLCVAFNAAIFACAMVLGRRATEVNVAAPGASAAENVSSGPSVPADRGRQRVVLLAFLLTGFAALSVEVLWTRVLTLVIGTTVYAFSAMLGTFLLGLAVGSAVFARVAQQARRPGLALGAVVAGIGTTIFLSSMVFGNLPLLYIGAGQKMGWSWASMMWVQLLFCLIIMMVPTFLMGGTFPLVTRIYVREVARVGSGVGTAYAFNTVGSILGAFAGSFIFLQFLGIEKSLTAVALIYLVVGLVLLLKAAGLDGRRRVAAGACVAAVGLAVTLLAPRWDPRLMTTAVYRYAQTYETAERLREHLRDRQVLFYDDGPGATVTVERNADELALGIDGKADASTSVGDMTTQIMLAHLPLLLHPKPDTVLVIGLGCGVTLGSVERYPVRAIDCVELLGNVVRASRRFDDYNYRCLDDPRVNLILADARNHVLLSHKKYDVIISEPTNPWIAGVGDLFTKEFFEMARERLRPGGMICAWFHIYHMGDNDLRSMAKTFLQVFPEASMWMLNDSDVIFLGSLGPVVFDEGLGRRFAIPAVSADLGRIWVRDPADVLGGYIWGKDGLARYAERSRLAHTDDNMLLEYSAGRKVFQTTSKTHLANFLTSGDLPPLEAMGSEFRDAVRARKDARRTAMRGSLDFLNGRVASAIDLLEAAHAAAPSDPYVLYAYVEGNLTLAHSLVAKGDYAAAAEEYSKAAAEPGYQRSWQGYDGMAFCYTRMGDYPRARRYYELSLAANPVNRSSSLNLAALYMATGDAPMAVSVYRQTLDLFPDDADAANGLARAYLARDEGVGAALDLARRAARYGKKASHYNTLGWALLAGDDLGGARRALEKALDLQPDNSEALLRLGMVEMAVGNRGAAREALERLTGLGRRDEYTDRAKALLKEMGTR